MSESAELDRRQLRKQLIRVPTPRALATLTFQLKKSSP